MFVVCVSSLFVYLCVFELEGRFRRRSERTDRHDWNDSFGVVMTNFERRNKWKGLVVLCSGVLGESEGFQEDVGRAGG